MKTLLLASVLLAGLFGSSAVPFPGPVPPGPVPPGPFPPPYHAYCKTVWLFASPCVELTSTILQQIQAFNPMNGCAQCQYRLVSVTPQSIRANHSSPDNLQVENLSFTFNPTVMTGGCRVNAMSTSLGFTSLIDDGQNYQNLYNILSASGLSSLPGFIEMTNDWACLCHGLGSCNDA